MADRCLQRSSRRRISDSAAAVTELYLLLFRERVLELLDRDVYPEDELPDAPRAQVCLELCGRCRLPGGERLRLPDAVENYPREEVEFHLRLVEPHAEPHHWAIERLARDGDAQDKVGSL